MKNREREKQVRILNTQAQKCNLEPVDQYASKSSVDILAQAIQSSGGSNVVKEETQKAYEAYLKTFAGSGPTVQQEMS